MPVGWAGAIAAGVGAVGSIAGGLISSSGAQSAASTQAAAATQAAQVQQNMFNTTQGNLQPWMTGGGNALAALQRALGLTPSGGGTSPGGAPGAPAAAPGTSAPGAGGPAPGSITDLGNGYSMQVGNDGHLIISNSDFSQMLNYPAGTSPGDAIGKFSQAYGVPPTAFNIPATGGQAGAPTGAPAAGGFQAPASPYGGFQSSPGYQFQLGQGLQAIQNTSASRGGLAGGNTLKALQQYGTGLANQDWYNYINQLSTLSGVGENAAANLGNNAVTSGANIGNALIGAGNATAGGIVGSSNAIGAGISNALSGGVNNYLKYSYLNGNPGGGYQDTTSTLAGG